MALTFDVARTVPRGTECVGIPVYTEGAVPRSLGIGRAALVALGFEGKVAQTLAIPQADGGLVVAVGMGEPGGVTATSLRKSAAALARAAQKRASLATAMADVPTVDARSAGQAVAEGMGLASYRFVELKSDKTVPALSSVTLVADAGRHKGLLAGAERAGAVVAAVSLARDLSNTPPAHLNARDLADRAVEVGRAAGLEVEVWDAERLEQERCNGLLAVNKGSLEPPRLVVLRYRPRNPHGRLALVGKGVTFDSGGLSLKPSNGMETMKMDMSGAGAVLGAMTALKALKVRAEVVGYLCCTDNLPSGSAMKVSDVITYRNGTTVEVMNTDAEGRLVLADALVLAAESGVDAIVDIATLTGACMVALGLKLAGVMGNNSDWRSNVVAAFDAVDEGAWPMPLPDDYRKLLDSEVADLKNVGGPNGGMLTAGLFLQRFVGDVPWAHLDIAGKERVDADDGINVKGATGFGVRALVELCEAFGATRH